MRAADDLPAASRILPLVSIAGHRREPLGIRHALLIRRRDRRAHPLRREVLGGRRARGPALRSVGVASFKLPDASARAPAQPVLVQRAEQRQRREPYEPVLPFPIGSECQDGGLQVGERFVGALRRSGRNRSAAYRRERVCPASSNAVPDIEPLIW